MNNLLDFDFMFGLDIREMQWFVIVCIVGVVLLMRD